VKIITYSEIQQNIFINKQISALELGRGFIHEQKPQFAARVTSEMWLAAAFSL
jgi:hypothetical protein